MAKIRVDITGVLENGRMVTFQAPCDCTEIDGLIVYYTKPSDRYNNDSRTPEEFKLCDAHGNDLAGLGNLFMTGAYVHVILDTVNRKAYIQNADTNSYLEGKFEELATETPDTSTGGNSSNIYSTEPTAIGTWIDGKTIYRKVFEVPKFPNNTSLTVAVGVDNIETVISVRGIANNGSYASPVPYTVSDTNNIFSITYRVGQKVISITTQSDKAAYSGFVLIEYTVTEESV